MDLPTYKHVRRQWHMTGPAGVGIFCTTKKPIYFKTRIAQDWKNVTCKACTNRKQRIQEEILATL